jgi:L-cysteine S-thiosulfotransferase
MSLKALGPCRPWGRLRRERQGLRWTHAAVAVGAGLWVGVAAGPAAAQGVPAPLPVAGPTPVQGVAPYQVVGDGIPRPLMGMVGDAARGRAIVARRDQGFCLLCHRAPVAEAPQQGNLASDLTGAGQRWTPAQLRLRVVDPRYLQPDSLMPAFHRTVGLSQVGAAWKDRPVLTAQDVEDVVAYLTTLKETP